MSLSALRSPGKTGGSSKRSSGESGPASWACSRSLSPRYMRQSHQGRKVPTATGVCRTPARHGSPDGCSPRRWLRATKRELSGYVAVDSPRRALDLVRATNAPLIEVTITEGTAHKRAAQHVDLIRELAPRSAADDARAASALCRKAIVTYFSERDRLPATVRRVRAPNIPPVSAVAHAYRAAIKAHRRGDAAARAKWLQAAKSWSEAHGLAGTAGIKS